MKVKNCPHRRTMIRLSEHHEPTAIFAVPCKRWCCPPCAAKKADLLAFKTALARPTHFLTLTVRTTLYRSPRDAYDLTRRHIAHVAMYWRRTGGEFEYVRFLETTKRGWPHWHLIVRSPGARKNWLKQRWFEWTHAFEIDLQPIADDARVTRYCLKYASKADRAIEFTKRRVAWTRRFFPPKPPRQENTDAPTYAFSPLRPESWIESQPDPSEWQETTFEVWEPTRPQPHLDVR